MNRRHRAAMGLRITCLLFVLTSTGWAQGRLVHAPAPPDNPLKGLVPYLYSDGADRFPHSLAFHYVPLKALMTGPNTFDFSPMEKHLNAAKRRRCQLIVRVYLEYPGKKSAVPDFLTERGLKMVAWTNPESQRQSWTPDYRDPALQQALQRFVAAFGKKYDGDPRLGYATAGLLGSWGEWHTHPRQDLWAPKSIQTAVMDAYEKAFKKTPVLLRYPAGDGDANYAANADRSFGYHDDSFAWATLNTGRAEDRWFFMPLLKRAGADDRWKTRPIGGEIRPELWKKSFTDAPHPKAQPFVRCIEQTHATWLMDSGLFDKNIPLPPERKRRAIEQVRRLGYEFHVSQWHVKAGRERLTVEIQVENRGVAPFYADWPAELITHPLPARPAEVLAAFKLRGLLPGQSVVWRTEVARRHLGRELQLRVRNPMEGGKPLRFANAEQKGAVLILGRLTNPE